MANARRRFIINGLGFVSLGLTMPAFLKQALAEQAATMMGDSVPGAVAGGTLPEIPAGKILVVVELSGGNDGLNTVTPYTDPAYAKLRPNIRVSAADAIKISDRLGLHPAMSAMGALFEKGRVAVIAGTGYPNPNRSHFDSMDIWQSANTQRNTERTGWLARYFDADGHYKGNPLSGLVLGSSLPLALYSHASPVSVVGSGADFVEGAASMMRLASGESTGRTGTVARSNADFIRNVSNDIYTSSLDLKKALSTYDVKALQAANYPNNNALAGSLQTIARLITGGLKTRIFYTSVGGFDTHANQPGQHANLLRGLSEAIAAFNRHLEYTARDKDVVTMTFSEFGRRVQENGSAGTDHGAASSMFVVGSGIRGGIYGQQPSLTDLDDGDLRFTTDFRSVYATVLNNWLGVPAAPVLGGKYPLLKFV